MKSLFFALSRLSALAAGAYIVLLPMAAVHGASVRQVSMDEMLLQCQLVFEGRVLDVATEEIRPKSIVTRVTFDILDVIKGKYPDDIITLQFLGGTVGGVTMDVGDMVYPRMDEQGIYFVESLERSQVHPLYGWVQGHFLVQTDDSGTERVMTVNHHPVLEIKQDPEKGAQTAEGRKPEPALSKGVARGIVYEQKAPSEGGMTASAFKKALREKIKKGHP